MSQPSARSPDEPAAELGRPGRIRGRVRLEPGVPLGHERLAGRDGRAEVGAGLVRDIERAIRIPAVGLLGEANLVGPERGAVRLLRILLVRAAEADVRPDGDEARPVVGPGRLDGGRDRLHVVAVGHALGVPAVRLEARGDILGPGHLRRAVELDEVVVIQDDELAESQVAGQARRFGRHALLEIAVRGDDVGPVIDDRAVGTVGVELGGESALGDGHADRVGQALAERTGRGFDAGRQAVLRVARRDAAPLAERLEVVHRDRVAGQVEQRVQQHAGVPGRQDEAVAIRPVRVRRGVAQEARPDGVGHRRRAHRGTRVARVGLLDAIDGQRADGVDGELVEVGDGHRWSS